MKQKKYEEVIEEIDMDKCGKIVITKPINIEHSSCPKCGVKQTSYVHEYKVKCSQCNTDYTAISCQDHYGTHSKIIWREFIKNNDLIIAVPPRLEYVLSEIHYDFSKAIKSGLLNAAISDIYQNISTFNDKAKCRKCGYCRSCVQCLKCKEHFKITKEAKCPQCGNDKYTNTYIQQIPKDGKCPHCKSPDIKFTSFFNKSKCPKCGSSEVNGKQPVTNSILIIQKFKGARS